MVRWSRTPSSTRGWRSCISDALLRHARRSSPCRRPSPSAICPKWPPSARRSATNRLADRRRRAPEWHEQLGDQAAALAVYERLSAIKTLAPDDILMKIGKTAQALGDTPKA